MCITSVCAWFVHPSLALLLPLPHLCSFDSVVVSISEDMPSLLCGDPLRLCQLVLYVMGERVSE